MTNGKRLLPSRNYDHRMPAIFRYCLLLAVLSLSGAAALAQSEREVKASPGKDVRVGVYVNIRPDCTSGPLPAIRLAMPAAHGAVTVKRATLKATNLKQCLAAELPALVAFYHSTDGYSGADAFVLEINSAGGHSTLQRFRVTVSGNAAGGQAI
jgi:uncharacterized membrane protein